MWRVRKVVRNFCLYIHFVFSVFFFYSRRDLYGASRKRFVLPWLVRIMQVISPKIGVFVSVNIDMFSYIVSACFP